MTLLAKPFNIMDLPSSSAPTRVLVVDDNRESADLTAELLGLSGYEARAAYSGVDGVQAALAFAPGVILLDLGMPGMDGYQTIAALRAMPRFSDVAIIAYTAWNDVATRRRTTEAGFDYHITKPATLGRILNGIGMAEKTRGGATELRV